MGFDVTAFFDDEAESVIFDLWRSIQDFVSSASFVSLGSRPHLTLGIYEHDLPSDASSLIMRVARLTPPISITLESTAFTVDKDSGSLFLQLQKSLALQSFHHCSFDSFKETGLVPIHQYWPQSWLPHCTLAKGLPKDKIDAAHAIVKSARLPDMVSLRTLAVVTFRPPTEHYLTRLG
jgi:hypothetical protein